MLSHHPSPYAAFEPGFRRLRREINLPALLAF